jgi:hypothetical protein
MLLSAWTEIVAVEETVPPHGKEGHPLVQERKE